MIEDQKHYSHPIYRNLIKFTWIIVIALQVRQEMFALGLALNFISVSDPSFSVLGLGS